MNIKEHNEKVRQQIAERAARRAKLKAQIDGTVTADSMTGGERITIDVRPAMRAVVGPFRWRLHVLVAAIRTFAWLVDKVAGRFIKVSVAIEVAVDDDALNGSIGRLIKFVPPA